MYKKVPLPGYYICDMPTLFCEFTLLGWLPLVGLLGSVLFL
jgi:hypothetical protein